MVIKKAAYCLICSPMLILAIVIIAIAFSGIFIIGSKLAFATLYGLGFFS